MLRLITFGVLVAFLVSSIHATGRMVCYYDSQSYWREGAGKMDIHDLESALPLCNHLVYGFAKIDADNFHLIPFDESKELDSGRGHYKAITNLKNQFPGLRVLLSVGGQRDTEDGIKYLTLVETQENRHAFIESAKTLLKQYKFDGLDLAWQLPEVKVKKERSKLGQLWHNIKKAFGYSNRIKDENEELHREGFNALLREAKQTFHREGLLLTAAVLPNVNSAIYYETRPTMESLEYLTIWAFDFKTPNRNSKEADFPSALYKAGQRKENETIDGVIRSWLERPGVDARKIFLGLQTFGRTWKLTEESQISGVPPITADGPGQEGPLSTQPGYFSYSEVCTKTQNPNNQKAGQNLLRLVLDPSHRTGSYSWRLPQGDDEGLWVGFQDIPGLIDKTAYVQTKGLGGVAMVDVSSDDFKGVCTGTKYPLLRAAKQGL